IPSLGAELRLTQNFFERDLPVVGIGAGACILSTAAGGGAEAAPLRFVLHNARRVLADASRGHLPETFPVAVYMRDRPALPGAALARSAHMQIFLCCLWHSFTFPNM